MADEAQNESANYERRLAKLEALLPAWFVRRMADDTWSFGLLTRVGLIGITHIADVVKDAAGDLWIEVDLLECGDSWLEAAAAKFRVPAIGAPTTDRTKATVAAKSIIAALELANT